MVDWVQLDHEASFSFASLFFLFLFLRTASSGCCPGANFGLFDSTFVSPHGPELKFIAAEKVLNLAYSFFGSASNLRPGLTPLALAGASGVLSQNTPQSSRSSNDILLRRVPEYEKILKQLSTLSRGVTIVVIILRSSGDQQQQEAELDLQQLICLRVSRSQISISPLRLPKPAKQRNLPKLPQEITFLCFLPKEWMGWLSLEISTAWAGINPLMITNFYPSLCQEKSCRGPFSAFTVDILLVLSSQRYIPYSPQQDLPVGSKKVCNSMRKELEVGLNLTMTYSTFLMFFLYMGSSDLAVQSSHFPSLFFLSKQTQISKQSSAVLTLDTSKNSSRPVGSSLSFF